MLYTEIIQSDFKRFVTLFEAVYSIYRWRERITDNFRDFFMRKI